MSNNVAKAEKCIADACSAVHEATTHDALERVQVELQSRDHTEVTASAAQAPEKVRVLIGTRVDHSTIRSDDFCPDDMVACKAMLRGQVTDASAEAEPNHTGRAD